MKINKRAALPLLKPAGIYVESDERLPNGLGDKVSLSNGTIISFYDKGTCLCQGKDKERVEGILKSAETTPELPGKKRVYVVYGHDADARDQLEKMLRRRGLEPTELSQIPASGNTMVDKLVNHTENVCFSIVLITPDEEGYYRTSPDKKLYRARQDVVLELGMLLSKLGKNRVAVLIQDAADMERPSETMGLTYLPFKDNIEEVGPQLRREMRSAGCTL